MSLLSFSVVGFYNDKRYKTYLLYVNECRKKEKNLQENQTPNTDIHHIIPRYMFKGANKNNTYCESPENKILVTREDHIILHELLFETNGNVEEQSAINLLRGNISEGRHYWRIAGAYASHKVQKDQEKTLWNPKFQKEMAQRSINKKNALKVRSEGGTIGGRNRNIGRVITKEDRYQFSFKGVPVLCTLFCETGGDVLAELKKFNATKIQRISPLLKGERKIAYDWSCQKIEPVSSG